MNAVPMPKPPASTDDSAKSIAVPKVVAKVSTPPPKAVGIEKKLPPRTMPLTGKIVHRSVTTVPPPQASEAKPTAAKTAPATKATPMPAAATVPAVEVGPATTPTPTTVEVAAANSTPTASPEECAPVPTVVEDAGEKPATTLTTTVPPEAGTPAPGSVVDVETSPNSASRAPPEDEAATLPATLADLGSDSGVIETPPPKLNSFASPQSTSPVSAMRKLPSGESDFLGDLEAELAQCSSQKHYYGLQGANLGGKKMSVMATATTTGSGTTTKDDM